MIKKQFLRLIVILIVSACNRNSDFSSSNYMTLDSVEYVTQFPNTYIIENSNDVDIDIIGYFDFRIIDSLMIFSTKNPDGFWAVASLPNKNILGHFLTRGQGPNEFLYSPDVQTATNFFKENGEHYAVVYDAQRGRVYKINLDETIKNKELDISMMDDKPPFLSNFVMIDTVKFLCKALNNYRTQQLRYIINNNIEESNLNLEKLNRAAVIPRVDHNIISTMTKYSKDNNIIVEMPVMLNYLNFYSIDGEFGVTICIGDKLNNINTIQNTSFPDIVETFYDLRFYRDFWGVAWINDDKLSLETSRKKFPSIFLFSWQREPLAELKLDRHITSFDIDFNTGILYGLDYIDDVFFQYDISNILKELKLTK